jgi:signal transduction histidine kinase
MPSPNEKSPPESFDISLVATIRCALATAGAVIFTLDRLTHSRLPELSHLVLILYVTYSVILYKRAQRRRPILPSGVEPWLDVGWAVALMALSNGPRRLFFAFAFFAFLIAAFQWGLRLRLRTALGSAFLFACAGAILSFARPEFELRHVFVGLTALVVLGYMTTAFGGRELIVKGRLAFMEEVSRLSNPRFGVDRTIGMFMERLRAFHDADACIFIMSDHSMSDNGAAGHHLRRVDRRHPEQGVHPEPLPEELAGLLLGLPADHVVLHFGTSGGSHWWQRRRREFTYDVMQGRLLQGNQQMNELLATTLEAEAFVTVPLHFHRQAVGRLYLIRRRAFEPSDVTFLLQVIEHLMPAIHHIRLVDRLASSTADAERRRIAHDLHDSVIQPYIWLCIGLRAIQQKLAAGNANVADDLQRLLDLTHDKIEELRRYTRGLKDAGEQVGRLLPAIRRFADNFSKTTGIAVQVEASEDPELNDQLAAELFQMVTEGLSNVLRHTKATRACITLARYNDHCTLQIANDGAAPAPFIPRSLTERASDLGGRARVERQADESTVVVIDIPL